MSQNPHQTPPKPVVLKDDDAYPLDDEIIERLVRIETRLCKLIVALGHEAILQNKDD